MADRLLVSTTTSDLTVNVELGKRLGVGLELQGFADPLTLAQRFDEVLGFHQTALRDFHQPVALHGAFYDMSSASPDPAVVSLTRRRYRQNLCAAAELGAAYVVFHLNYLGAMRLPNYRQGWLQRQIEFWADFTRDAARLDMPVLLENSWEDDPTLITDVVESVASPYLRACLDVAHATLYSSISLSHWIEAFRPHLVCAHLNNHDGELDLHWPLDQGVLDYGQILPLLRRLPQAPLMVLEMNEPAFIQASLPHFLLGKQRV
ncbi:MAG: TIM barrel protein [Candidatus Promineifilaceae bacterium]|nr:TIM barrel protein [Candidatus Promineifilaceae bacterium]